MAIFLYTVAFESATSIPADTMVNTWHFEGSGSDPVNVADMLTDYYEDVPTGAAGSIVGAMTAQAFTGDIVINAYNLSDPKPRAPVYTVARTLAGIGSGTPLPSEVALVMSYHAASGSGVPPARRRGRVYLGGFGTGASGTSGGSARPTAAIRLTIASAGRDLIQASNASVSWSWVQYSQLTSTANLVTGGWCDDSWDTQRRRGAASTVRTTFTGGTP